ncbi:MAG: hypothetical protein QN173_03765 [Armatimonadota bacterium]|nr:hypothetical protein [Armatimonadota bacterium]MDR7436133.1 hypothetical protein [Armatimonadota bacterium]MDR7472012.1 hypothetical protein [Armatimonadota bacterium]MDR7506704.1 hypothetical protein [Armatimonadota bacterium]MDR7508668.1 hypothetical protein [Armatimonadota bacterium]
MTRGRAMVAIAAAALVGAAAAPAAQVARNLAENVLGPGTVRWVVVSPDGQRIDIAWDTVLYHPGHTVQRNREQMRGEAELATGAIMGVLWPQVIHYAMLRGGRTLARGWRTREGEFGITYAAELGGSP